MEVMLTARKMLTCPTSATGKNVIAKLSGSQQEGMH